MNGFGLGLGCGNYRKRKKEPINLIDNGIDYVNWTVTGVDSTKSAEGIHLVNKTNTETAKLLVDALQANSLYELTINIKSVNTTGIVVVNSNLSGQNIVVQKVVGLQNVLIATKSSGFTDKRLWFYISSGAENDYIDFEVISLYESVNYAVTTTPKLIITFDDAYISVSTRAFQYMKTKGLTGTVYAITDRVNTTGFCTDAQLDEMYAEGWCISNHTYDHTYLSNVDKATALEKIGLCQYWLYENGYMSGLYHFAYPGGQYNDNVLQALDELGIKTARTTAEGNNGQVIPELYKLNTYICGGGAYGLSQIQTLITNTISQGKSLFLLFHRIVDTPEEVGTDGMNFLYADFQTLCNWITTQNISVMNVDGWYKSLTLKNPT